MFSAKAAGNRGPVGRFSVDRLYPIPVKAEPEAVPTGVLEIDSMKLTEFVLKEAVIPGLKAKTKEAAIREMVASLKAARAIAGENEEPIVAAILKREELGSTGIGRGVAVPHTKHASVSSLMACVAISHEGLDFASLDGDDVFILFLLVSPPDRPGDHLRGLETITRHLKSDDFCKFLKQAKTREAVLDLLQEADNHQV